MSGKCHADTTLTRHLRSWQGLMSPTCWCRHTDFLRDMSACLSFWGGKIPDTTPTFPAKSPEVLILNLLYAPSETSYFLPALQYLLYTRWHVGWRNHRIFKNYWPNLLVLCIFLMYHVCLGIFDPICWAIAFFHVIPKKIIVVGLDNIRCQYQEVSIVALIVGINRFFAE
jgi:hypothetical protein